VRTVFAFALALLAAAAAAAQDRLVVPVLPPIGVVGQSPQPSPVPPSSVTVTDERTQPQPATPGAPQDPVDPRWQREVVLEPRVGGRIFERTRGGDEHDWGEVTAWEPPARLGYLWHLRRDRADATEVEIRFLAHGDATRVEIEHRGWERLGARGREWRDRNHGGWSTLLPHYVAATQL